MRHVFLALTMLVVSSFSAHAAGHDEAAKALLKFENPYAFATTDVQKNGAAFMVISSHSDEDKQIVSASADVAERIELHTHIMEGDVMMMREVESYDIPANGSVTLEPMGYHVMLIGLKAPLVGGESFPLTLTTAKGEEFTVSVEIKSPADTDGMDHMMDHKH